jgi:hypothetical protein
MLLAYGEAKGTRDVLSSVGQQFTPVDILQLLESKRGETLMASLTEGTMLANAFGRFGAKTWLTACVVLLAESGVHRDIIREFLTKLRTGEMLAAGSPILAMRRWMMSDTGWVTAPHNSRSTVGVGVFIKTLNGWLSKEHRNLAIFKIGIEPMPTIKLPENFLTAGTYGDDERTPLEIEETLAQELEESKKRESV